MTDLAQLGISLTSTGVNETNAGLDAFAKKADAAGAAADGMEKRVTMAWKDAAGNVVTASNGINTSADRVAAGFKQQINITANTRAAYQGISNDAKNLSYQLVDVGQGLLSGQPLFQIFAQQAGQIGQVLATTKGSAGGLFKEIGSGIAGVLTPMRLFGAGVAGLAAGAVYLGYQWSEAQTKIEQSLIGIGARTGSTSADLNKFAAANASATGLSIDQARNAAIEFTKTGNISVAGLKGVGDAIHGFSIITGKDATESTKVFAEALGGNLVQAAEKFNQTYGFLNSSGRDYIRTLELQGDRSKAMQFIIDSMADDNKKATDSTTALGKAWDAVANALSRVKNATPNVAGPNADGGRPVAASPTTQSAYPNGYLNTTAAFRPSPQDIKASQEAWDKAKADGVVKDLNAISLAGDNVVKSIIPQIDQIQKLEAAQKALQDAQNTPGVKINTGQSDAASVAIQNQIAALRESQAQAERYNQRVQAISVSWGHVGQSVALTLQSMNNQLPVAQAWTESGRMLAQYQATYNDLIDQGKTAQEATAVASKQEELSKAAAVASAQKMVQASNDNLEKIQAQGTGMEGVVASAIAYRDAIQAGATQTQAAAIAANTLAASLAQAAQSAQSQAQTLVDKENGTTNGILDPSKFSSSNSTFNPSVMPKGTLTFAADPLHPGAVYRGGGGGMHLGPGNIFFGMLQMKAEEQTAGVAGLVDDAYSKGGISSALAAIRNAPNTFGAPFGSDPYTMGRLGPETSTVSDKTSAYETLTQLLNAQTTDKSAQADNLKQFQDWLQTLPETIERDQKIISVQQSIDGLKNSVDANTSALNQVTLNPLYTQGHGALPQIGYFHAANGLDMTASGPTSGDQVPFHAMINGGERVRITKPGESDNDNASPQSQGGRTMIVQNFDMRGMTDSKARRSSRHVAQGYGAAVSAVA